MFKSIKGFVKSKILRFNLWAAPAFEKVVHILSGINVVLALSVIISLIYSLGFSTNFAGSIFKPIFHISFYAFLIEYTVDIFKLMFVSKKKRTNRKHKTKTIQYILYFLIIILYILWLIPVEKLKESMPFLPDINRVIFMVCIVGIGAILKLSSSLTHLLTDRLEPQFIMVGSFLFLIIIGTTMLMFPKSTYEEVPFIDTLFLTVSSVCVTGLTPIDVSATFTLTGQIIILFLIQFGGIGIMTFTSFFGLMFSGSNSAQNKMLIKDLIDPDNSVSQIFSTLRNILFITFLIEMLGALGIYYSIGDYTLYGFYVAIFHAISAFCNAGISIIPDGLNNPSLCDNYALLHVISWLIILGGIGFPILFNLWQWIKNYFRVLFKRISGKYSVFFDRKPRILASNTIIVLIITAFLIISGTIVFFITEYDNILSDKSFIGKYFVSFFMAVTPRTAGFNAFPMTSLMPITVMYMILYMWVGGSPMSTAGGIKTTTFGIAILNIWNTLRGRDKIEIRHRSISSQTINKSFIIIFASLAVITTATMLIIAFEPDKSILAIVFEVVSAFSTVGLSLDLTPELCTSSKIVIIWIMFIGRMGLLTILGCFITRDGSRFYEYPSENIPIN